MNQEFSGAEDARGMGERVGILGGTFDPIHYAHLALAEEVYHALHLTRVVFVPAGQPPHKMDEHLTPVNQRVQMLTQALADNAHFELSLVDVQRTGPSYTVDMLRLLRAEWGGRAELYFILGGDSLRDLPGWYDPMGVIEQATLVALTRPGYGELEQLTRELAARLPGIERRLVAVEGPRMDLSSTELRQRVAEGRPIRYQTPEVVEHYILRHGLYRQRADKDRPEQEARDAHATNAI